MRLQSNYQTWWPSYLKTWLRDNTSSKPTHLVLGRPHSFMGIGLRTLISCWPLSSSPFSQVPCHRDMSTGLSHGMAAGFLQNKQWQSKYKPETFYDLISEVAFHNICLILFIITELIFPAHIQWGEITCVNAKRLKSLEGILAFICHMGKISCHLYVSSKLKKK